MYVGELAGDDSVQMYTPWVKKKYRILYSWP